MAKAYGFKDKRDAETLRQVARERRLQPQRSYRAELMTEVGSPVPIRYAKLTAALSAAGSGAPLTDATTATAVLLNHTQPEAGADLEEGEAITVVNRSQDLTGSIGDFVHVGWYIFEWAVYAIDCPAA